MRQLIAAALLVAGLVSGCGAPGEAVPAAPAEAPTAPAQVPENAPLPGGDGWSSYDALTGPKLVYRDQDMALMQLACLADSKDLIVSGALGLTEVAGAGEPAAVAFAGDRFAGQTVIVESTGHTVALSVPITADLLSAIATSDTARLIKGESFMDTAPGGGAALAGFARACGQKAGLSR